MCNGRNVDTSGNFVNILQVPYNALHFVSVKGMNLEYFARIQNHYTLTFLDLAMQIDTSNDLLTCIILTDTLIIRTLTCICEVPV